LRTWKTSQLGTSSTLKGGFYVPEGQEQGITDLSQINNSMIPSSIHAVFGKDNCLYVTHYTQGLRLLDTSDPENLVEVGYYDDFPTINFDQTSDLFFRKKFNWAKGIFGLFPDQNRPDICYAGGSEGFYIFDVLPISAPTGFTLSGSVGENPTLSWNASSAVGLDGYKLYQKFSGSYSLRVTLDRNTTSFTDNGVIIGGGRFDPRTCYILTAFNITGRESATSIPRCTGYSGVSGAFVSNDIPLDDEEVVSYQFNLLAAYPNPFNPSTQISYSLAEDAYVTVKVYDMLGTEVANLINETQTAGIYERNFNAENLASGVYIYRVVAVKNGRVLFTDSKQIILMK